MRTFVVIGAGVTGLSTAYHLLKRNAGNVIVVEKDVSGAGSSSRAAGITNTLLWTRTGVKARQIAVKLFAEWSNEFPGYHYFSENGCLGLFDAEGWAVRKKLFPLYREEKAAYEVLEAEEIHKRWPLLHPPGAFVGLWDPNGGYSEPHRYLPALRNQIVAIGGKIVEGTCVRDILVSGGKVHGVATHEGTIKADAVIITTYAWTNLILQRLGIQIPIKSFIHQRYITRPLTKPLDFPPINADPLFGYIRPAEGNRILLGVETPDRLDHPMESFEFQESFLPEQWRLAEEGRARFEMLVPELKDAVWETAHTGLINFSMDGEPILGTMDGCDGLVVGTAFHSGGFSYSPVSGMLLAELADSGETSVPIGDFSPNRYSDKKSIEDHLAQNLPQKSALRRRH